MSLDVGWNEGAPDQAFFLVSYLAGDFLFSPDLGMLRWPVVDNFDMLVTSAAVGGFTEGDALLIS